MATGHYDELVERLREDESLKKAFKENPRAVIFDTYGFSIPDTVNITVLEETDNESYFIIPRNPAEVDLGELSDVELEVVAGGTEPPNNKGNICGNGCDLGNMCW